MASDEGIVAQCVITGLTMYQPSADNPKEGLKLQHAPVSLQPSPMTGEAWELLHDTQHAWNILVDRVARDTAFLRDALKDTAHTDPLFTGRMLSMMIELYGDKPAEQESWTQPVMLGILRSDYIGHPRSCVAGPESTDSYDDPTAEQNRAMLLQHIEINTISVAFPMFAPLVGRLHKSVALQAGSSTEYLNSIQVSGSAEEVPLSIAVANTIWCQQFDQKSAAVLFVVQEGEINTSDQYMIELALHEHHGIRTVFRKTLLQVRNEACIVGDHLYLSGEYIGVVYFRAAYRLADYGSTTDAQDMCWQGREMIERSTAVKCPSLLYHLAGTKRVQQLLSHEDVVRRYLPEREATMVLGTFLKQFAVFDAFSDEQTKAAMQQAVQRPELFVLKPQKEGGGNLLHGAEMVSALTEVLTGQYSASAQVAADSPVWDHVLMRRAAYYRYSGEVMRQGKRFQVPDIVTEVGSYGTVIGVGPNLKHPALTKLDIMAPQEGFDVLSVGGHTFAMCRRAGYVARSKSAAVEDGGVVSGINVLDSVRIV